MTAPRHRRAQACRLEQAGGCSRAALPRGDTHPLSPPFLGACSTGATHPPAATVLGGGSGRRVGIPRGSGFLHLSGSSISSSPPREAAPVHTHRSTFGTRETHHASLTSSSGGAGRAGAAVLTSGTLL